MIASCRAVAAAALVAGVLAGGCVAYVDSPGEGQEKVLVCHKGRQTLELPEPAVDAHLRHGDHLGPCR